MIFTNRNHFVSLKGRLVVAGSKLMQAFEEHNAYDLSWGSAAYVLVTKENPAAFRIYKLSIVLLQLDWREWDKIYDAESGNLKSIRNSLGKKCKAELQRMLDEEDDKQSNLMRKIRIFGKIFPKLNLNLPTFDS